MTVKQLKKKLEKYSEDTEVIISGPDIWEFLQGVRVVRGLEDGCWVSSPGEFLDKEERKLVKKYLLLEGLE